MAPFAHHEIAQERTPIRCWGNPLLTRAARSLAVPAHAGLVFLALTPARSSSTRPATATPREQALLATPAQGCLTRKVAALGGQQAILDRLNLVPACGRVKAAHECAVLALAKRILQLVAVAPLRTRRHDLLHLKAVELADPPQRILHLLGLDLQLALVGQHLPRDSRMGRLRGYALGAWTHDLNSPRMCIASLALAHNRPHRVAGNGARHEHHIAALAVACNALTAVGEPVDRQLKLIAPLRASHATNSSSNAFCA